MRARLAFALAMVIEFDCFLIDEVVAVGDSRFHAKCHTELFERRADRSFVIVSHDTGYVREHCERVYVLKDGTMYAFPHIDEAVHFHEEGLVN
jgi:capsular polysaccharide transport system ATP-binding protein